MHPVSADGLYHRRVGSFAIARLWLLRPSIALTDNERPRRAHEVKVEAIVLASSGHPSVFFKVTPLIVFSSALLRCFVSGFFFPHETSMRNVLSLHYVGHNEIRIGGSHCYSTVCGK